MKKYNRILLKLSGESLMGSQKFGIDSNILTQYAREIKEAVDMGVQISIVIGGGNIFRGMKGSVEGFDRIKADSMGMLATCINSLALSSALDKEGIKSKLLTSTPMEPIASYYSAEKAISYLNQGFVVIIAGGTGNPLFTTDTGAALRAIELKSDIMLKGTRVDGIYTDDPEKNKKATKYDVISYNEVIVNHLQVMDLTATTLCMENGMAVIVFNMDKIGNLSKVLNGNNIGTLVR